MLKLQHCFHHRTLRSALAATSLTALLLAGCSSGGTSISEGSPTVTPTSSTSIYAMQFVGTFPNTSPTILRFNSNDSGAVAPDAALQLPADFNPYASATDKSGNYYLVGVSVVGTSSTPEVLIYAEGASGSAAPTRVVTGSLTGLTGAETIAVDPNGLIYVLTTTGTVNVYSSNANGNSGPTRTFNVTSMATGTGLAADSSGNVYVGAFIDSTVQVYGPSALGNATPIRTINGAATQLGHVFQLAVDSASQLYVGTANNSGQAVLVFAAGATGNQAPTRAIEGSATGFNALTGIAVDSAGQIYEADAAVFSNLTGPSVNVFAAGASGNVAPKAHFTSTSWGATSEGSTLSVF